MYLYSNLYTIGRGGILVRSSLDCAPAGIRWEAHGIPFLTSDGGKVFPSFGYQFGTNLLAYVDFEGTDDLTGFFVRYQPTVLHTHGPGAPHGHGGLAVMHSSQRTPSREREDVSDRITG